MMKEDFENRLSDIVDNSKQVVDHSALWVGIETKLARKKRRVGVIWFSGLLLLLLVAGIIYLSTTSEVVETSAVLETPAVLETLVSYENTTILETALSNETTSEVVETSAVLENSAVLETSGVFEPSLSNENTAVLETALSNGKSHPDKTHVSPTNAILNSKPISPSIISELNQSENESNSVKERTESKVSGSLYSSQNTSDVKIENAILVTSKLNSLQMALFELEKRPDFPDYTLYNKSLEMLGNPMIDKTDEKSALSYFGAISVNAITYNGSKQISNNDNSQYLDVRNSTEILLDAYSIGGNVKLVEWKGLSLNTGLRYNYLTDVFEWEGDIFKDSNRDYLESILYTLDQGAIENYKNGDIMVRYEKYVKKYNEHHFIDLPIGLAYQLKVKSFSARAFADMNISYKFNAHVNYINQDLELDKGDSKNQWLKANYSYGIDINYNWNRLYSIGLRLTKRAFNVSDFEVENTYSLWGIGLSANRYFD